MPWPTMSDYQEAIQNPRSGFADPELQHGQPVLDRLGLPRPITGGFASVYQLNYNGRKWAVRCFLREFQDHQRRYEAISHHLKACNLRYKVDFVLQPRGIRVHGQWYPILKMEWVDGKPLNTHVESILQDRHALQALAHSWSALVKELSIHQIAHGDLQHGNVLVANGSFKLIDYDGMYVPALRGLGSHEEGHPAYQHPRRSNHDFGPYLDNFAALAIYVALAALREQPDLWSAFDNGDNFLFRRDDFLNPSTSQVFAALQRLRDPAVLKLVKTLHEACKRNVNQVPHLEQALEERSVLQEEIVICPQCRQKNRVDLSQVTPHRICKCGKCGYAIRTGLPEWVQEQMSSAHTKISVDPHPSVRSPELHFVLSWKRPGLKREQRTRYEPIYEQRQRQIQVGEEPIYAERVRQVQIGEIPVYEERTRQVKKKVLWGIFGKKFVTETHKVQIGIKPIMKSELYRVQTGTRPIIRMEPYTVQVGTRPVVEETQQRIEGHTAATNAVCFSDDGSHVLSVGDDGYIFIWHCVSGDKLRSIRGHNQKISGITRLVAERFATCSWDQTVKIWRHDCSLERMLTISLKSRFYALAAPPDGKLLAGAIGHKRICVWDTDTGKAWPDLRGHTRKVLAVSFFPDGKRLVSGASDMTVRVWDMRTKSCEKVLYGHSDEVNCVAVSPNAQLIASGGSDGAIRLWDAQTGTQRLHIPAKAEVFTLAFSPDARYLWSGGSDQVIRCWDVHTGQAVGRLYGHTGAIRGLAVSPDGRSIASCSDDYTVQLWKSE